MDWLPQLLETIGHLVGDDATTRGALVVGGAALGLVGLAWRALRGRSPRRSRVVIDAEPGQYTQVTLGADPRNGRV